MRGKILKPRSSETFSGTELRRMLGKQYRPPPGPSRGRDRVRRPAGERGSAVRHWTAEEEKLLGRRPDFEVAQLLKRTPRAVEAQRLKLGRKFGETPVRWTPEEIKLLGAVPDEEVARRLGRGLQAVITRRQLLRIGKADPERPDWTKAEDALLRQLPDAEVALRTGRSWGAVKHRRSRLGLGQLFSPHPQWNAEEEYLLGTTVDAEVARKIGRTARSVA